MKSAWRWLIAIAVTVGLLWWALRGVPWSEFWLHVRAADPVLVVLAVFVANLIFPLRAARWRPILEPVAPDIPYGKLWRATAVGFMANNLMPARAGELLRPYMLSRETTVPFAAAFASQLVDRVFDAFIVLLLVAVALLDPAFPGGVGLRAFGSVTAAGVLGLAVALYVIVFAPQQFLRVTDAVAGRIVPRFAARIHDMTKAFADGLAVLRDPRRFVIVSLWALALWVVQAVGLWIMFRAMDMDAPFSAALLVQGLIVLAVSVPQAPGFFGSFEAAARAGLAVYGISETAAAAWALSFHVLSMIPISVIGLYYLARSGISLDELRKLKP